ncbi:MAG: DinB family protein [Acidobacteria bacterium]|nr:DinB family protein [Acidobacteriota bacterium]
MTETPQQYTARILGYIEGHDPQKIQRSTAGKLAKLVRGIPRKKLGKRPGPDKWSVTEILAHLAETEWVIGYRIRTILSRNGAPIEAFNQDDWAKTSNYAKQDPKNSLALFRALREANLSLLKSIPKEKWEYFGMHQERGKESVAHIFRMIAGHDLNHLSQVALLLGKK